MAVEKGNENVMAAVAYLGWWVSGLILLLVEKQNKHVRYHAAQSLVLFGGMSILMMVFGWFPILGWSLYPISFVLWLVLMWKAFQGEMFRLPYVAKYADMVLEKVK